MRPASRSQWRESFSFGGPDAVPSMNGDLSGGQAAGDLSEVCAARVLVVEDDEDHAFLISRDLSAHWEGALELAHARSLAAALDLIGKGGVDCVLLDLSLPDAKGLQGLLAVRSLAANVPVVVLTGLDSDEAGVAALRAGAEDYLVKGHCSGAESARALRFAIERASRQRSERERARLARHLGLLLDAAAEGVVGVDADGVCTFVNPAGAKMLGRAQADLIGSRLHPLIHPGRAGCGSPWESCLVQQLLSAEADADAVQATFWRADGTTLPIEARTRPVAEGGVVLTFTDLTDRLRREQDLARRELQLAEAQRVAHLGSFAWDLVSHEIELSAELTRLLEVPAAQKISENQLLDLLLARVHPDDLREAGALWASVRGGKAPSQTRFRVVRRDGAVQWMVARVGVVERDSAGRTISVLGTMQDVTEAKRAEDALAYQAMHDPLTGLPNRTLLVDRLTQALGGARRNNRAVGVIFLDIDHFKWINDGFGHGAADELLIAVARALQSMLRPSDTLARLGGDEFVLLCEDLASEDEAVAIAERVRVLLEAPFQLPAGEMTLTVSMGIATSVGEDHLEPETIIADADVAMYRAKERGRARYEVFKRSMRERTHERAALGNALGQALDRGELVLHYQPIVDVASGSVRGVEALVRWEHPTRGLIAPADFVPLAEELGAIVPLGSYVLREACRQVMAWSRSSAEASRLSVAVNLSPRQLGAPDLAQIVRTALEDSGLPPERLWLEVTEGALMHDVQGSSEILSYLRSLGVHVSIDDFGTGYSSLAYLRSLPIDSLKIDRSFVDGLGSDEGDRALVRGVLWLADALGLGVVAEGVETEEQRDVLSSLGCETAQGHLWAPAVSARELVGHLARATARSVAPAPAGLVTPSARATRRGRRHGA